MPSSSTSHYSSGYFRYQEPQGQFGGWADLPKFERWVSPDSRVVDFGCGGGFLLARLRCRERKGVEINPVARSAAAANGIDIHASIAEIPTAWADLVISNHALEHCPDPLEQLRGVLRVLRPGGRAVFVVPCESIRLRFSADDVNRHLYSWSPGSLANLFLEAGFKVEECRPYVHAWPPRIYRALSRISGALFHACARIYGALTYWNLTPSTSSQVRIVARRPGAFS
ncbi:MAG: class I SAM-dependent methyltransferase [Bryobacteraceae bacterium]